MSSPQIPGVKTFEFTRIIGREHITFGSNIIIDDFVFIYAKAPTRIGNYVHIATFSSIMGGGTLEMDDFSGLSAGVRIVTGSDDFQGWGFGNPTVPEKYRNVKRGHVRIGRFSIVGTNAVILPDVTLGEGTAVAAGSVVTKDLQPWGVYVGNRRVAERDREGILRNYEQFVAEKGRQVP